jgi:hypothetical protein
MGHVVLLASPIIKRSHQSSLSQNELNNGQQCMVGLTSDPRREMMLITVSGMGGFNRKGSSTHVVFFYFTLTSS